MNKVCVITNAGSALGGACAREMAKNGYSVAMLDGNVDITFGIADNICTVGGLAKAYAADCNDYESLSCAYSTVKKEFGTCTVLVNLPGRENNPDSETYDEGVLSHFNLKYDQSTFDSTVKSILLASLVFVAEEKGVATRTIVNVSDNHLDYYVEKGRSADTKNRLLDDVTRGLAAYFANQNVRVNGISLGCIMSDDNIPGLVEKDGTPSDIAKKITEMIPLSRLGRVEDVCGALSFLTDNTLSGFITGEILHIDGGFGLHSEQGI